MEKLIPQVGDVWIEKARTGRRVEILSCGWNTYSYGKRQHEVSYITKTVHNKRAQKYPTITSLEAFQQRFEKHYEGLEDL